MNNEDMANSDAGSVGRGQMGELKHCLSNLAVHCTPLGSSKNYCWVGPATLPRPSGFN